MKLNIGFCGIRLLSFTLLLLQVSSTIATPLAVLALPSPTALPSRTSPAVATAAALMAVDADGSLIGATSLAAAAGAIGAVDLAMKKSPPPPSEPRRGLIADSANLLLELPSHRAAATASAVERQGVNLTRHHDGDVFRTNGVSSCNTDTCVGLSSGTAGLLPVEDSTSDMRSHSSAVAPSSNGGSLGRRIKIPGVGETCHCRCLPYLRTYREDLGICVDDIHECSLSPFVSGSSSEKIPFVFLPLRGQIIYPSREISFPDIRTPVCAVTGAQYLTTNGWAELRNPIDTDYPFRMFRDEGRTFLQWLGEPELRKKMQGRLIVVHLVCRDMTVALNATYPYPTKAKGEQLQAPKNVFSPCVAFRVNGAPVKYFHNVSEVLFQAETTSTLASTSDGMTTKEYVVIGICSLLLGLIYVSSVFLYLHMKKRKSRHQSHKRGSLDDLGQEINYPKNDQVTFGAPFNRSGSLYSATSLATSNEPRSRASIGSLKEEMGIVKNNPLLQHFPQLSVDHHSGFTSDISNSNSECEMDGAGGGGVGVGGGGGHDKLKQKSLFAQMQTAALVHPQLYGVHGMNGGSGGGSGNGSPGSGSNGNGDNGDNAMDRPEGSPTQETECLPVENVSITEDMMTEEKLENLRAMMNGNIRKKLYFNPAYFEPHLLAQPPPAAIEFLQKIREVIAIAKYKMATKRYQPSLIMIPEEGASHSSVYGSRTAPPAPQEASVMSSECHSCLSNSCSGSGHARNCGDKRNSIEKWLESVPITEEQKAARAAQGQADSRLRLLDEVKRQKSPPKPPLLNRDQPPGERIIPASTSRREFTPPKQRPPPPPTPSPTAASTPPPGTSVKSKPSSSTTLSSSSGKHKPAPQPPGAPPKAKVIAITHRGDVDASSSIRRNGYEPFSPLASAATPTNTFYGFSEPGGEIYNNPKFMLHDSPSASTTRSHSSRHSKASPKRLDGLEQYVAATTPTSLTSADRQHYEMLRNMKRMPGDSIVYDAIGRNDYSATLRSNSSFQLDIPTPDYDSTMEKKIKDIYNNTQSSGPSVPTPDYSTLSRRSLKQMQPDSPIYRRKSPQYLIVDYETDSLERLETTKRKSSNSSSSPSSDVSSQLSPSLSTALPLEEELEINHTAYDQIAIFRKSGDQQRQQKSGKALGGSGGSSKQKEMATRIKYDTPFRGSMTIEVEHEPPSDLERSTDSDQFEPDTLDRKPKKQSFCDALSEQLKRSHPIGTNGESEAEYGLSSLPDLSRCSPGDSHQSTGHAAQASRASFILKPSSRGECNGDDDDVRGNRAAVNVLRELYQQQKPLSRENSQQNCKCGGQARHLEGLSDHQGRLLTLEAKHSRRQRANETTSPPPVVEISQVVANKTTIKITTPKVSRAVTNEGEAIEAQIHMGATSSPSLSVASSRKPSPKAKKSPSLYETSVVGRPPECPKKRSTRSPLPPPPPPPPTASASTTLTSQRSNASSAVYPRPHPHYQNQVQYLHHSTSASEEEVMSSNSESTEFTGVSETVANSEIGGSCQNTLTNVVVEKTLRIEDAGDLTGTIGGKVMDSPGDSPQVAKKKLQDKAGSDYAAMFNTEINGLRSDYSLTKYLNRRKTSSTSPSIHENEDESMTRQCHEENPQPEVNNYNYNNVNTNNNNNNNNNLKNLSVDHNNEANRLDVISISSRSNRSSSRLSDRTKEMYRNAGVPVGIAYPQRSSTMGSSASGSGTAAVPTPTPSTTTTTTAAATAGPPPPPPPAINVQTVYRCEIEPVQLTHGMQIAMGLKDRAKKAKDLKNAWRKFVSLAASKFSPTQSPAPPFDKKLPPGFLDVLDRDEGISSLILDADQTRPPPPTSTPQSSYSAPTNQNYYEQRFGHAAGRGQEMDSGYMSADSAEMYKRNYYDRYNFRRMSGRERIIRVDTISDHSDGDNNSTSTLTGGQAIMRRDRFEDIENIGQPPAHEIRRLRQGTANVNVNVNDNDDGDIDGSDADSNRTLTHDDARSRGRGRHSSGGRSRLMSSDDDDERASASECGSSETDGETNVEDMWESGAESIETHSVLYKNVRKTVG